MRTPVRDDAGVTLIELLVAMTISGLIAAVIAGAFAVGVKTTDDSNKRLAGSQGAQLASAVFAGDVQSSSGVIALGATPCSGGTPTVADLRWTDVDATPTTIAKRAEYSCQTVGTQRQLVRRYYENSATPLSTVVLVYDVTAAALSCTPDCTTPASATLTATEAGGFTFAVTGSRRVS